MKKRHLKTLVLILLSITLFLEGCGKEPSDRSGRDTKTPMEGITDTPTGSASQRLDEEGITEEQLGHPLALTGKALGTLPVVGTEDEVYCNLPENQVYQVDWENDIIPICYDPLYGILYYVDYGGDYMIHMIRDGEEELVVGLPARKLFCRGGRLYFLVDSYGQFAIEGAKSGNILSYNPVDGQISLISDEVFDTIVVYQDLIYCAIIETITSPDGRIRHNKIDRYLYFFDTGRLSDKLLCEDYYPLENCRYQESFLVEIYETYAMPEDDWWYELYLSVGIDPTKAQRIIGKQLCRWDGSESTVLTGMDEFGKISSGSFTHYIKGDYLLWAGGGTLHSYHIPEQRDEVLASTSEGQIFEPPYMLMGEQFYGNYGDYLDIGDGILHRGYMLSPDYEFGVTIRRFYTDGENLYAIAHTYKKTSDQLYRVKILTRQQALREITLTYIADWVESQGYERVLVLAPMDEMN